MADLIAKYRQMAVDYKTHEALVTFAIKTDLGALEEELKGYGEKDILLKLSAYSPKRSLNANAYFHALCREIAKKVQVPEAYIKNKLVAQYGQYMRLPNGDLWVYKTNVGLEIMWEQEAVHTKVIEVRHENGKNVYFYAVMKPTHEYTVSEMSRLIEGTVSEAKELDIPTISDAEVERLLNAWGK